MNLLLVIHLYHTKHKAMKTQNNTTQILPSPVKFSIYLIAVALVCFLNWNALNASDYIYVETEIMEARLDAALVPVTENEIVLEEWMLEVVDGCLFAENNEPRNRTGKLDAGSFQPYPGG